MDVFPKKALVTQYRYMRRFVCTPCYMSAKDYIARVVEINSYLTDFPCANATSAATMLSTEELLDLLEFGILIRWQKSMVIHGFDPLNSTIKDLSNFYKRLESTLDDNKKYLKRKKKGNFKDHASKSAKIESSNVKTIAIVSSTVSYIVLTRPMTQMTVIP